MLPQRLAASLIPLMVVLLLTACPVRQVDFGKNGEAKDAAELLKRIELAEATVVGLKGDAKLGVDSPQGKGSVGLFVAVQHPALLHLEQLDFFNRPQAVLTTDGTRFALYDAAHASFFRGPATAQNLGRFLPIVLPPRELTGLLLGRVPRINAQSMDFAFDAQQGLYLLTLKRGEVTQVLSVQPPTYRVVKSVVTGIAAYDVEFSDVADFGAVSMPRKATLIAASAKTRIELTYKEITLNPATDLTMFELEVPANVPVTLVDETGAQRHE